MVDLTRLNKNMWNNITQLKLLTKPDASVKFLLEHTPFDDEDEDDVPIEPDKCFIITGRIFPNSDIYKEGSYRIQIMWTPMYFMEPPTVRFLTNVYHPHVYNDGRVCPTLFQLDLSWHRSYDCYLANIVRILVKYFDNPEPDYAVNYEVTEEYMVNKSSFDRKAMEYVKRYALPRD